MTRPAEVFDSKMQHERTSLAWERTAIAAIALGLLMTRAGATVHPGLGLIGIVQVCAGAALLVWSGKHYEELHGTLRAGQTPAHPQIARLVGVWVTVAIGLAIALTVAHLVAG
jgi:uncharacterized membrane protein YidH (DUF202 family)